MKEQRNLSIKITRLILLFMSIWLFVDSPSSASVSPEQQITFTPMTWLYLPIVFKPQNEPLYTSHNLNGHSIFAECNPGGTSYCPCSDADVRIISHDAYGEIISNPLEINTYVNAIGGKKFIETLPNNHPISLGVYSYKGQISLPVLPAADIGQIENPQAAHMMIQLWDGRNALYQSNKTTLEGIIYWDLNPWTSDYGKIKIYVNPLTLVDTGITLNSDTEWHTFELVVDLANQTYVSISIDEESRNLSHLQLAQVPQPAWGDEVALLITTESLAAWSGQTCPIVFTWATRFKDLELRQQ